MPIPKWIEPALNPPKKRKTPLQQKVAKVFKDHVLENMTLDNGDTNEVAGVSVEVLDVREETEEQIIRRIRPDVVKLLQLALTRYDYARVAAYGELLSEMQAIVPEDDLPAPPKPVSPRIKAIVAEKRRMKSQPVRIKPTAERLKEKEEASFQS